MVEQENILLERVKQSDKDAFHQLFTHFHDILFRFIVYRVHDPDLAEDITQDTFLRVWKTRDKIQPEKSFFSLIARIGTNLCYDHFRHMEVRHRHQKQIPEFFGEKPKSLTLVQDLRWLIESGFVTEYSDGRLFAPPIREGKQIPRKSEESAEAPAASESGPEQLAVAEEPTEIEEVEEVEGLHSNSVPGERQALSGFHR